MKKIKEGLYTLLYVFVIISSMIPQKNEMKNIEKLNYIMPGIDSIYSKEESNTKYSIKIIEIIKKYCNM